MEDNSCCGCSTSGKKMLMSSSCNQLNKIRFVDCVMLEESCFFL